MRGMKMSEKLDYEITNTITPEEYLDMRASVGWRIMINLQAAKGKEGFYKKFGFIERPNENFGPGMHLWIEGEA